MRRKKMYVIEIDYSTGNSFGSDRYVEIFEEVKWEGLGMAKEALKRIKEHYLWYEYECSEKNYGRYGDVKKIEKPGWWNCNLGRYSGEEWYFLNLPLDNGKEFQFRAYWCGFFEQLYGAQIVLERSKYVRFIV